jgi:hypothetical protein
MSAQYVFDMGERLGVLGGGFEHKAVVLRPDGPGAVAEHQSSALPLSGDRLDSVLAAEMGEQLLRATRGASVSIIAIDLILEESPPGDGAGTSRRSASVQRDRNSRVGFRSHPLGD